MPQFIEKDGDYYLRKTYDHALTNKALELLKDIEVDQFIDEGFFNLLCNKGEVALLPEDFSAYMLQSCSGSDAVFFDQPKSDSLGELVDLISEIERRYEEFGISLEIKINTKSNP